MRTVTVRLNAVDLSAEMAAMRAWLDDNRYEPSRFTCERYGEMTVVCVDFEQDAQAEAFTERFEAQNPLWRATIDPPPQSLQDYADADSWGPRAEERESMLQVCRWRIMAEEIRTEADGFSTGAAKETMHLVAETWDQMAENLEKRLTRRGKVH